MTDHIPSATDQPTKDASSTAGERKAFDVWLEGVKWLPPVYNDALRAAFNAGAAWGRPLTAPAVSERDAKKEDRG